MIVVAETGVVTWGPDFERLPAVFYYGLENAGAASAFVRSIEGLSILHDVSNHVQIVARTLVPSTNSKLFTR